MSKFRKELETLINRNSMENGSDTPDFLLAEFLTDCLAAFDRAVTKRESWYGRGRRSGGTGAAPSEDATSVTAPPPPEGKEKRIE